MKILRYFIKFSVDIEYFICIITNTYFPDFKMILCACQMSQYGGKYGHNGSQSKLQCVTVHRSVLNHYLAATMCLSHKSILSQVRVIIVCIMSNFKFYNHTNQIYRRQMASHQEILSHIATPRLVKQTLYPAEHLENTGKIIIWAQLFKTNDVVS